MLDEDKLVKEYSKTEKVFHAIQHFPKERYYTADKKNTFYTQFLSTENRNAETRGNTYKNI